jgi:hypothetical protein
VVATPVTEEVNGTKIGRLKIQMMLHSEMTVVQTGLIASIGKSVQKPGIPASSALKCCGK